ncbi:MAG: hypothetical protein IK123_06120, partial [Lachnospiraceae bacterium]|nr:hypothetical protein [Lachnospiraceae bacterium]
MERDRYILLCRDENIKKIFEEVFDGGIKVFDDLRKMQDYVAVTEVDDGAIFFEYASTRAQVEEFKLEKKELLEFSNKHFFKVICLYHGVNPELSPEVMEHLYDFIDMDESPYIITKKLRNMRKSLLLEIIINDVLDMSSFEGRNKMSSERFNLFKMMSYIASVTYQKCVDKGITYELNIQKDVPEFLIGDRIRLNQVFLNLMTGTVQKSPEGCTVSFNIESEVLDDTNVRMKFIVEGKGFMINARSRMVEMSHGTIEVENLGDDVTRITIIFTAQYDKAVEIDTAKAAERFVNTRVAVIGRDSKVRVHTTSILEQLGFTTECFNTLQDFRNVFKDRNLTGNLFSVCMIDGELENDEDIVREVRAMPGMSSAMIIVNTYNPDRLRMEYLRAGANAVVGKSISRTQIYNTMMQIAG